MTNKNYKSIKKCRACNSSELISILNFGHIYVSDFNDSINLKRDIKAPLELVICNSEKSGCGLMQLKHTVINDLLYRNYWYRSGINATMKSELQDIVKHAQSIINLSSGDIVLDIGANDGTLLRAYKNKSILKIGYEPANNLNKYNSNGTNLIINDYFSHKLWKKHLNNQKAKIITAVGMFYDLDNPNKFLKDIYNCLHNDGVFIVQMMYLPFLLERNAFDGVCHEHLEYYSLGAFEKLLLSQGFEIVDIELRKEINEGSVRYIIKKIKNKNLLPTKKLNKLREKEKKFKLNKLDTYIQLSNRIESNKKKVVNFLASEHKKGKLIHGYAASTKGNTTLQYYGLNSKIISAISDRNPEKWGKLTVGTQIPVISETKSRKLRPDYYFVLAWHFLPEFIQREKKFLEGGGEFIVPMPRFTKINQHNLAKFLENNL